MPEFAPVVNTVRDSVTAAGYDATVAPGSLVGNIANRGGELSAAQARRISIASVVWTACASTLAVVLGVRDASAALTAFGAIGYVDAVGSVALAHHFGHPSERFERRAHRIVRAGLVLVGCGAVVVSVIRLAAGAASASSVASDVLAALSVFVLSGFAIRKVAIASMVASPALRTDGHLSAIGAMQAAVALGGLFVANTLGWWWADATAAIAVGMAAIALGLR